MFFGWDRDRLEHDFPYKEGVLLDDGVTVDPACQLLNMTRREVMQNFGTEAVRNGLHKDAWIIILRLAIERGEYDAYDFGFLTDCRFKNELQFVRDMDGFLIKVIRSGAQGTLTDKTDHASETDWLDWNDWDFEFANVIFEDQPLEENLRALRNNLEFNVVDDILIPQGKVNANTG